MTNVTAIQEHAERFRQIRAMAAAHAERLRQIHAMAGRHAERVRSVYAMAARYREQLHAMAVVHAERIRQIGELLAEQSRRLAAIAAARAQRRQTHEPYYALRPTSPALAQPPPRIERIVVHDVIPAEPRPNRRIGFASWDCPDRR